MKEFKMFCGLSGAGKSSYIQDFVHKLRAECYNVEVLSSDALRKEVYGDVNDQTHNKEVFDIIHTKIRQWATREYNKRDILIVDATNLTRKNRMAMLNIVKQSKDVSDIHCSVVVIATPVEKCIANDAMRERTVGRDVILKQLCKFSVPQRFEGWDEIDFVRDQGVDFKHSYDIMERMIGVDQNNPHHKYTLFEHCMKARYIAEAITRCREVAVAAQYHDIGKLFTKTTDENGVSHYYNHANVSAYYMMVNSDLLKETSAYYIDVMRVLFLIENHMIIRDIDKHCSKKYRKIWGDTLYDEVLYFSKIDEEASSVSREEHIELDNRKKENENN